MLSKSIDEKSMILFYQNVNNKLFSNNKDKHFLHLISQYETTID
jgi:hypothetical protein